MSKTWLLLIFSNSRPVLERHLVRKMLNFSVQRIVYENKNRAQFRAPPAVDRPASPFKNPWAKQMEPIPNILYDFTPNANIQYWPFVSLFSEQEMLVRVIMNIMVAARLFARVCLSACRQTIGDLCYDFNFNS